MNRFYVYALVDPRTEVAFYVGKGCGARRHAHLAEARRAGATGAKVARIREIVAAGLVPQAVVVRDGLSEPEAFAIERQLILAARRDPHTPLLNTLRPTGVSRQREWFVTVGKPAVAPWAYLGW